MKDEPASAAQGPATPRASEQTERDWGLSAGKPRFGREAKIGLAAVVCLLAAGGYLVYRKLGHAATPGEQAVAPAGQSADGETNPDTAAAPDNATSAAKPDPFAVPARTPPATPAGADPEDDQLVLANQTEPAPRRVPEIDPFATDSKAPRSGVPAAEDDSGVQIIRRRAPAEGPAQRLPNPTAADTGPADDAPPATNAARQQSPAEPAAEDLFDQLATAPKSEPPAASAQESDVAARAQTQSERDDDIPALDDKPAAGGPSLNRSADPAGISGGGAVVAERLGDYQPVRDPAAGAAEAPATALAAPGDMEDRLGGYVPEELGHERAVARTKVSRPAPTTVKITPPPTISHQPVQLQRGIEMTANPAAVDSGANGLGEPVSIRPAHRSEPKPIQRRATPTALPTAVPDLDSAPDLPRSSPAVPRGEAQSFRSSTSALPLPKELDGGESYTVEPNDNFWKISKKEYGTARLFQALSRFNQQRIADPTQLRPGMVVAVPPREVLEQKYPDLIEHETAASGGKPGAAANRLRPLGEPAAVEVAGDEAESNADGYFLSDSGEPMYRVGHDDTLTSISKRHLGRSSRWNEIYEKNKELLKSPDALKIGTVIRLPTDASRLSVVPDTRERR